MELGRGRQDVALVELRAEKNEARVERRLLHSFFKNILGNRLCSDSCCEVENAEDIRSEARSEHSAYEV